jgi:hypothetical protein
MARDDWYRRTTWTGSDQCDFWEHFDRARSPGQKSQYLSIQAIHLRDTGKPELIRAAIQLLQKCVADYSDQQGEMQRVYHTLASSHVLLKQNDAAASAFMKAIDARRAMPHYQTDAPIDFAVFVISANLKSLCQTAESILVEFALDSPFPLHVYRYHGALAILAEARGDRQTARQNSHLALQASGMKQSGLPYHQQLGVVRNDDRDSKFHKQLEKINKQR